ncbi:MAG: hypothetical protein WA484_04785 [Solirubrobacteraceae bacterium]
MRRIDEVLTKTQLVTKTELIAKADAVCTCAKSKRNLIEKDELAAFTGLADDETSAGSELSTLVPPNSMTNDWNRITGGVQEFASDLTKPERYARAKNPKLPVHCPPRRRLLNNRY